MKDRELLEMAAKAAGFRLMQEEAMGGGLATSEVGYWHPLADDRDALRLAVMLRLEVGYGVDGRVYAFRRIRGPFDCGEDLGSDPYAATRRAIVRAAAEIGAKQ